MLALLYNLNSFAKSSDITLKYTFSIINASKCNALKNLVVTVFLKKPEVRKNNQETTKITNEEALKRAKACKEYICN